VDTATFSSSDSYSHGLGDSSGVVFNDDGTKVFISDYADRSIYQRNLSTAFDVSSVTGSQTSLFLGSIYPNSLSFNNDGTKLYVLEYNAVKEYALTTAFDVTSGSLSATESLSSQESAMQGLTFNNDGTKMFTVGDSNNRVYEYALSSAFDISSLSYTDNLSIQPQESNPQEIKFNHDGTKMYISGYSGDDINEYTLSSAFDISSTVTHKGVYSVSSSDGSSGAYGFSFNNDGTKLFTTGTLQDRVNEHSLTTPFSLVDVSGEHSGDVINTSSTDNYDTDPDSDTLTVTAIRTGSVEAQVQQDPLVQP
jgi:sugar lactone lactonase YvrE